MAPPEPDLLDDILTHLRSGYPGVELTLDQALGYLEVGTSSQEPPHLKPVISVY
jgi:hypothetical protein